MIEFDVWKASNALPDRDWLIIGKGPTFERRAKFDLSVYNTMSLNHVIQQQPVDVAHMIDFDVADACADAVYSDARWLLMPRYPHIGHRATLLSLDELLAQNAVLARMEQEGRVVVYDLDTATQPARGTVITAHYFSSEAALDLVGHLGARNVATLGVDGGQAYAGSFSALAATTRLANGQPSFSVQFDRMTAIARRHDMVVAPLVPPLRVYVGVQERELVAAKVLEFTIHQHASQAVQVVHLPTVGRTPVDRANRQRTPFSFSRFLIPELNDYAGRALYVDSDMQVFDDIARLWDIPFEGAKVMCTNQTFVPEQWRDNPDFHPGRQMSVMMLDCENLPWKIDDILDGLDEGRYTYQDLMFRMCLVEPEQVQDRLPEGWNHLEHFIEGETKLLHYTVVPTQPWKSEDNPLRHIWEDAFVQAARAGYVSRELVERHVRKGHVRRSLLDLMPEDASEPASDLRLGWTRDFRAARNTVGALRSMPPRLLLRALLRAVRVQPRSALQALREGQLRSMLRAYLHAAKRVSRAVARPQRDRDGARRAG
jgi:hypothetical protein